MALLILLIKKLGKIDNQQHISTGEAGNEVAIDAFNEGLIDKYIQKSSQKLQETLGQ